MSTRRWADRWPRITLWFYGGFRYSGTQNYVAGGFKNKNPAANQYCANAAGCTFNGVAR